MTTLGVVTIGQAPRVDMLPEMIRHWPGVRVEERGALDGMTAEQIDAVPIRPGDEVLTSRLADGGSAVFGRDLVLPRLQQQIADLESGGVDATLVVCTGVFPPFAHRMPLFTASPLLVGGVRALASDVIGVVCPLPEQQADSKHKFGGHRVVTAVANPYSDPDEAFARAAEELVREGASLVVLDCMGYTEHHRAIARTRADGRPVVLARSLIARLVAEAVAA